MVELKKINFENHESYYKYRNNTHRFTVSVPDRSDFRVGLTDILGRGTTMTSEQVEEAQTMEISEEIDGIAEGYHNDSLMKNGF